MATKNRQGQGQELKTEQRQLATQIQKLASKLLEIDGVNLNEVVDNEVESNMALEKKVDDDNIEKSQYDGEDNGEEVPEGRNRDNDNGNDNDNDKDNEVDNEDYNPKDNYGNSDRDDDGDDERQGPVMVYEETLLDHMEQEILDYPFNQHQIVIAQQIIGNIDNGGYLRNSTSEIAQDLTLFEGEDTSAEEVEEVLGIIQHEMDPAGVGARDVRESLLLQLQRRNTENSAIAQQIVASHFEDLTAKRFDRIAAKLGTDVNDVKNIVQTEIVKLHPRPGSAYATVSEDKAQQITPDFVISVENEKINIELPNRIPDLQISKSFEDALKGLNAKKNLTKSEKEERKGIIGDIDNARIFIQALKMRQETLMSTMTAIVEHQKGYFTSGGDSLLLKPLKLEDLEEKVDRETSTLSRATQNKYVEMPWGIKPLKFFFITGLGDESTVKVQAELKKLIDNEDKKKPLSDANLCKMLKEAGYSIERRTVAKYREQMNIPAASGRKEY